MPLYLSGSAFLSRNLETFLLGFIENIFYAIGIEFCSFSVDVFHGVPKDTCSLLIEVFFILFLWLLLTRSSNFSTLS